MATDTGDEGPGPSPGPRALTARTDDTSTTVAAEPTRPARRPSRPLAWSARLVLLLAVLVMTMVGALLIGLFANDRRIDANRASATATVLSVSALRTGIEFVDGTGLTVRPPGGVLYPGLLTVGQQFVVEYSVADPTIVRVAGRSAAVGVIMVVFAAGVDLAVACPLVWWLRRRSGYPLFERVPDRGSPDTVPPDTVLPDTVLPDSAA